VRAADTARPGQKTRAAIALAALIALGASLITVATPVSASERAAQAALALEEELLHLHNQTRRQVGVRPLDGWTDIRDVNRSWSRELARTPEQNLRHNPNRSDQLCCWTGLGENIARFSMRGLTSDAVRDVATRAMDGWRGSPDHWASLSNPDWQHMGVGVAIIPWDGHPGYYLAFITLGFRTPNGATNPASIYYPHDSGPPTHNLGPEPEPTPTPEPTPAPVRSSPAASAAKEPASAAGDDALSRQGARTSVPPPDAEAALWDQLPEEKAAAEDPAPTAPPARGHPTPTPLEAEAAVLGDTGAPAHAGSTPQPVNRTVLVALGAMLLAYAARRLQRSRERISATG
jgi:uncharacterized protein YkwD